MPYPVEAEDVVSVTWSPVIVMEDGSGVAADTRIVVACNDIVVGSGSGVILIPEPKIFTVSPIDLPCTDSGSYKDTKGNLIATDPAFTYRVDIEYQDEQGNWIKVKTIKNLLLPLGPAVDLDLVLDNSETTYTSG